VGPEKKGAKLGERQRGDGEKLSAGEEEASSFRKKTSRPGCGKGLFGGGGRSGESGGELRRFGRSVCVEGGSSPARVLGRP